MGIQVSNAVWQHSKSEGRARLVLLAIADHQGDIGAWPSIATLARMVNASERSVQRDIQTLVDLGELEVQISNAPTKQQYKSNLYWVKLSGVTELSSGVTAGVTESDSGVTESDPGVTTDGALTLIEPLKKPIKESKGNKAHALPADFKPSDESIALMSEHFGWIDLKLETHSFKDYWSSKGGNATKTNWDSTWRNWIRQSARWTKDQNEPAPKKHQFILTKED